MRTMKREKLAYEPPYRLNETIVSEIILSDETLTLKLAEDATSNQQAQREIQFTRVDLEASYVKVYRYNDNEFKGKVYTLAKFIKKFAAYELELIEEVHDDYLSDLRGYLTKKDKVRQVELCINYTGDMIYGIDDARAEARVEMVQPVSASRFDIANTTWEERKQIVYDSLGNDASPEEMEELIDMYWDYIEGKKELAQINAEMQVDYYMKDDRKPQY